MRRPSFRRVAGPVKAAVQECNQVNVKAADIATQMENRIAGEDGR